ncbi:MAG: hypothetical protein K2Q01_03690 [Rickettsiales bacterium]|nr:hypothetical protein [Rickettsiales bacterium]
MNQREARIATAMRHTETVIDHAAAEHWQAFMRQMHARIGVESIALHEPYLPYVQAKHALIHLRRLEKLRAPADAAKALRIDIPNPNSPGFGNEEEGGGQDAFDAQLEGMENRLGLELKQSLDSYRQQAFGLTQYIWRTAGDDRVRPGHAAREGQLFTYGEDEEPGEDYGCRCAAEPALEGAGEPAEWPGLTDDQTVELVFILASLLPIPGPAAIALRLISRLGKIGRTIMGRAREKVGEEGATVEPAPKPTNEPLFERPEGVPKEWKQMPADKQQGTKYIDPKNSHNDVRIQKGNPSSPYPLQREDYVRWKKDGRWLDKNGKPSTDPKQTHIPLEEFKFISEIFK